MIDDQAALAGDPDPAPDPWPVLRAKLETRVPAALLARLDAAMREPTIPAAPLRALVTKWRLIYMDGAIDAQGWAIVKGYSDCADDLAAILDAQDAPPLIDQDRPG
jgi:hypothetical protein